MSIQDMHPGHHHLVRDLVRSKIYHVEFHIKIHNLEQPQYIGLSVKHILYQTQDGIPINVRGNTKHLFYHRSFHLMLK